MKFIDINCMIGEWGYHDLRFKTAEQLFHEMRRLNISGSFVFHSKSWLYDQKTGNESIVDETKGFEGLIPVISITSLIKHEFGGRSAIIDYIRKNGIGAVRLFPNDHHYTLNLWNIDELFSIPEELGMPVLLDAREKFGSIENSFQQIYDIARIYKNVPMILLTVGYRHLRVLYHLMEKCGNICIDTSTFITFRGIEDVVRNFGPERVFFGTRAPFIEAGVSVGRVIYADISDEARQKIAYGNAMDLIRAMPWLMRGGAENEA